MTPPLFNCTMQAAPCRDHAAPLLCGPASHQLAEWVSAHCPTTASGGPSGVTGCIPSQLGPAACLELFARMSAAFMHQASTQNLWQLAAAVSLHLGADPKIGAAAASSGNDLLPARPACGMPAAQLNSAASLKELQGRTGSLSIHSRACSIGGSGCCTEPGCLCHLSKVRSVLVSTANRLELSVRGRGVARVCVGAAGRDKVLQEAALMHMQAGDAERCCELLVEVGGQAVRINCNAPAQRTRVSFSGSDVSCGALHLAETPSLCWLLCCCVFVSCAAWFLRQGPVAGTCSFTLVLAPAHAAQGRCTQQSWSVTKLRAADSAAGVRPGWARSRAADAPKTA